MLEALLTSINYFVAMANCSKPCSAKGNCHTIERKNWKTWRLLVQVFSRRLFLTKCVYRVSWLNEVVFSTVHCYKLCKHPAMTMFSGHSSDECYSYTFILYQMQVDLLRLSGFQCCY